MDMRQLIAQIDHIENKQILNEHAHYTAAPVDNRPRVSKSNNQTSIYEMLIKEFGYDLGEQTLDEVAFSPEQQAKMGQANPQDPYIVARVLGKTAVPLSHFTDPADQAIAKQLGFKDGPTVAPAAPAGTAAQPAATPAVSNPQNPGGMSDEEMLARQNPGGMSDEEMLAQQQAAPGSAAQPAAPAATSAATPQAQQDAQNRLEPAAAGSKEQMASIMNMQKELGVNPDGKIGPKTRDAMARKPEIAAKYAGELGGAKQFPGAKPAGSAAQPATKPGAPNQSDAETARLARQNAALAAGNAAKPAAAKVPAMPDPNRRTGTMAQRDEWMAKYGKTHNMDGTPKKPAGSGAQPAATKSALPGVTGVPGAQISDTPAAESVRSQDDAILERIRTALFR